MDEHGVGTQILDMVERVKTVDKIHPGAQAEWVVIVDDVRYRVTVNVDRVKAKAPPIETPEGDR